LTSTPNYDNDEDNDGNKCTNDDLDAVNEEEEEE
jgi:hypothetical protein